VLAALMVAALVWLAVRDRDTDPVADSGPAATAPAPTDRTPAPGTAPPHLRSPVLPRSPIAPTGDAGAAPARRPRLAGLFEGDCQFGVDAHCRVWAERAARCDDGDAGDCADLGELLISEAPMQPLWGSLLLARACELGRDEVCARAEQWQAWSRFGYSAATPADAAPPVGLVDACAGGNQVACGLIEMHRSRGDSELDLERALAACRAGFRDACATILGATTDPKVAVDALTTGCHLPDAWMCFHLAGYYSDYCTGTDRPAACPAPNPGLAARYRALACQLDPLIAPCRDQP
jgi:hypothetical protein